MSALAAVAADPAVTHVTVSTGPWLVTFAPSGEASAQYGSTFGDAGNVPVGTVDFAALLGVLRNAKTKPFEKGDIQVSIHLAGETSSRSFVPADTSFVEQVLRSLDSKWQPVLISERFHELREQHPIVERPSG